MASSKSKSKKYSVSSYNNDASTENEIDSLGKEFTIHSSSFGSSIRIFSLNCCLFPFGIRTSIRSMQKQTRRELIVQFLLKNAEKFDIIALQEVFSSFYDSSHRDFFLSHADLLSHFPHFYSSSHRSKIYHLLDSGLLIFSKFRIVSSQFLPFLVNPDVMFLSYRGFQHVELELPSKKGKKAIHLMNLHLHPEEGNWPLCSRWTPARVRKVQVEQIARFLKNSVGKKGNEGVILCGDFNIDKDSEEGIQLCKSLNLHRNFYSSSSSSSFSDVTMSNFYSFASHRVVICSDFFLANNSLKFFSSKILHQEVELSDHWPIVARVEWKEHEKEEKEDLNVEDVKVDLMKRKSKKGSRKR